MSADPSHEDPRIDHWETDGVAGLCGHDHPDFPTAKTCADERNAALRAEPSSPHGRPIVDRHAVPVDADGASIGGVSFDDGTFVVV